MRRSKVSFAMRTQSWSRAATSTGPALAGDSIVIPRIRRVSSEPRTAPSSMAFAARPASPSGGRSSRSSEAYPRMEQRMLLKSWAIPEASVPTASRRRARWSCSASWLASVTSSTMPST